MTNLTQRRQNAKNTRILVPSLRVGNHCRLLLCVFASLREIVNRSTWPLLLLLLSGVVFSHPMLPARADDARKVVIPFDFESKFDGGRYGSMVGDMVWKKLSREGGFVVPESMEDVRDYCASHKLRPAPDTSLDRMKKIVLDDFGGQIGIWGGVERAPDADGDIYDLIMKCYDFSAKPAPRKIYEVRARTESVSEIPHVYVKQMLDALAGREPEAPPGPDPTAEAAWHKNPNLVSGDFERGAGGVPKGWDRAAGQQREPLGRLVRWTEESSGGDTRAKNCVILFTLDRNVAENEGVMYYSDFFPVEEGAKYRFQCRWRSDGPAAKVFVKCYAEDESGRRREVYRSQQNLKGPKGQWNTQTEDFTPKHTKYAPRWGRIMLYAYLQPGRVEWDDVVVKLLLPASPGEAAKTRRPSAESGVTVEEMRENERRGRKPSGQE